jgi:hypothetical protein
VVLCRRWWTGAARCFIDFFTANIRNPNIRVAYGVAVRAQAVVKRGKTPPVQARRLLGHVSGGCQPTRYGSGS